MALLALFFYTNQRETELTRYEQDLKAFRAAHGDTAELLQEPVEATLNDLRVFQENPLFAKMPPDLQTYVNNSVKEATAYVQYSRAVNSYLLKEDLPRSPRRARSLEVLDRMEVVPARFPVPAGYQEAWQGTEAVRRIRDWPDEIKIMRREVAKALAQIKGLRQGAAKLKDENWGTPSERLELRRLLSAKEEDFKYREGNFQTIPGTQVTFSDVGEVDVVREEWRLWLRDRADRQVNLEEINKGAGKGK